MKSLFKSIVVRILTAEARLLLARKKPTIIAITGSVGKTTTKDAVYAALKDSVPTRKSQKSFNSELGVPLTVLGLRNGWNNPFVWIWNIIDGLLTAVFSRSYPSVLVLEVGVDTPGDMKAITRWLHPDVVILTRLPDVPVHVEHFSSPEAVIEEKMLLVHALQADGTLVYNADDQIIQEQLASVRQKTVGYSRYADTDVMAKKDTILYENKVPTGVAFTMSVNDESHELSQSGVLGVQSLYSLLAAVAVAKVIDVDVVSAVSGLSDIQPTPGRMRVLPGLKDSLLLDDTYNSSPIALENALDTMAQVKHKGRRIAVLGDMLELGKYSSEQHERLGEKVGRTCDALFTVGVRARGFAVGALNAGMQEENVLQYDRTSRITAGPTGCCVARQIRLDIDIQVQATIVVACTF